MFNKGKYVILQLLLMLISPITSFIVCLRFYKSTISQIFMIVFAFYFGMLMEVGNDLANHYNNMQLYYAGKSISEILRNPLIYGMGHDYFHVAVKIFVSRFSNSPAVFGGVLACIYGAIFLLFFREFSKFYKNFLPVSCGMILLAMVMIVQFYWYQGVRFWPGAFFFAAFIMKYVNTGKKIYILISFACVWFHFSLYTLVLAFFINWILDRFWVYLRYILFAISLIVRVIGIDLLSLAIKYIPYADIVVGNARTNEDMYSNTLKFVEEFRETANPFYHYRQDIILLFGIFLMMLMWSRKVVFSKQYSILFFYGLTLFTIANFGYTDFSFYTRFFKFSLVFFYSFLFVVAYQNYDKIKGISLIIMIVAFVPLSYEFLTQLVEERRAIFNTELLFGNFFIDWHGGAMKRLY